MATNESRRQWAESVQAMRARGELDQESPMYLASAMVLGCLDETAARVTALESALGAAMQERDAALARAERYAEALRTIRDVAATPHEEPEDPICGERDACSHCLASRALVPAPAPEEPRDYAPCHGCRKYQGRRAEACDARVHRVAPGEACEHLQPIAAHPADCACRAAPVDQAPETGRAKDEDQCTCDFKERATGPHADDCASRAPAPSRKPPAPAAPTRAPGREDAE